MGLKSLNHMMLELRQIILMLCEEFVGHLSVSLPAIIPAAVNGSWQMARYTIVGSPAMRGGDGHLFDPAGKLREQRTLGWQCADMDRVETGLVHHDRHLDACALGQVGDQLCVGHIAVELEHVAALQGVDDVGGVFMPALQVFSSEGLRQPGL